MPVEGYLDTAWRSPYSPVLIEMFQRWRPALKAWPRGALNAPCYARMTVMCRVWFWRKGGVAARPFGSKGNAGLPIGAQHARLAKALLVSGADSLNARARVIWIRIPDDEHARCFFDNSAPGGAPLALASEDCQSAGKAGSDLGRDLCPLFLANRRRIFLLRAKQKFNPRHPCG